jgi:N-acetylglucosamine-6-phosphate deacetylase
VRDEIARRAGEVGIVTLAPEIDGAIALIEDLVACGHRVSLGHSGADYDAARAGISAGACHATHLFNRMPPLSHRAPGLIGAVLESDAVAAEIIFDGEHVHPAVAYAALRAKSPDRVMAITDASSVAGLPIGSTGLLGGRRITAHHDLARLDDGTIAGSVLTMDRAFRMLVGRMGVSILDAVKVCSATPARELGLDQQGAIEVGAFADLTVLDEDLQVVMTLVGGHVAYTRQ